MSDPLRVYIAGPYTKGDVAVNVRNAILAGDRVLALGAVPFIPHLTHFWHLVAPKDYEQWMAIDFEWLKVCQVCWRIPGESAGADREVAHALQWGSPLVVYSEGELAALMGRRSP